MNPWGDSTQCILESLGTPNKNGKRTMSGRKKKGAPLPASSAGLLRFFEDETEGVKIRPEIVLVTSVAIIITSIILNLLFK